MTLELLIPPHTDLEDLRAALRLARDTCGDMHRWSQIDGLYRQALYARTLDEFNRRVAMAVKIRETIQ